MGLSPGARLGPYEIVARLGAGGMGEVYRARDPKLDRDVAIKVLVQQDGVRPQQRERFLREARAASALNHPNIITVHEIGSEQGLDFIVMEFVRGTTLQQAIKSRRMGIGDVLTCARQVADGLSRAHASGIVHRDLKPANVMITDEGLIKVLDFGLAKFGAADEAWAEDLATEAALTRPGTSMGTLGYMSPEQALGAPVDARSDVFSFGVILFEMLALRRPFAGGTSSEVLHALHFEEPPLDQVRPDTSPPLMAVLRRCLAKQPAERYPTMTAVADVLRTLTASGADTLRVEPMGWRPRARRWPPQRRGLAAGTALLVVAVGAAAVWRLDSRGEPSAPGVAEAAWRAAAPIPPTASAVDLTTEAVKHLVRQDREADVNLAIERLERALAVDANHAPAYAYLSEAYFRRYKSSPDPQWLTLARDRAERAVALNADLAIGHLALGLVELDAGQTESATRHLRRAVELDPRNPYAHMGAGQGLAVEKRDADAEAAFRKAIELGGDQWRPHTDLGQFYYQRARYGEAIQAWEQARAVTPDNLIVLRNLGAAYYRTRRYDDAASALQRALEIRPSGTVLTNLGNIYFLQGRYSQAVEVFEKVLELDANNFAYWGNLGDAYRWAAGRRPEAASAYRRASEILVEQMALKPEDPDLRTRHALYLAKSGDTARAVGELARLRGVALTAQMQYRAAVVRELAADRAGALDDLERALKSGYPSAELGADPELMSLRTDPRYHRLVSAVPSRP